MRKLKRSVVIVVVIAALVLLSPYVLFVGTYGYDVICEHFHRIGFDSGAWQDVKRVEGDDPIRIRMVDDLIGSHRLDGLSRSEVEKLLGKPTATEYFKEYDSVYWLGPERGLMGIDSEWLAIAYDQRGVVRKYGIVRD